jgi:hypothetical protein
MEAVLNTILLEFHRLAARDIHRRAVLTLVGFEADGRAVPAAVMNMPPLAAEITKGAIVCYGLSKFGTPTGVGEHEPTENCSESAFSCHQW